MQETVLELKNYSVSFDTPDGEVQAVRNVDLTVKKGEILCIVGESGCGKTVMCRSVMKLLPPNAHVKSGEISLCGENITAYKRKKMEKLCGSKVSMVFQDPMLTLNPTIPVGKQITEAIIKNQKVSRDEAKKRAVENAEAGRDSGCRTALWPAASFFFRRNASALCAGYCTGL